MNILICSHPGCVANATVSCLKDPFGKSDEYVSYCPLHAPGMLRGTQAPRLQREMSPAERFEQKVSFVYGQMKGVTKEEVRTILEAEYGYSSPKRGT